MARLIRRHSMERLELYDLDKLTTIQSIDYQLPPPLPPPRMSYHHHRRPSINPSLERYQFLCNMSRTRTDPIYAATPMFTTIPQLSEEKHHHRQLLGCYIRSENVTPLAQNIVNSSEPKKIETVKDTEEEEEEEEEENEDKNDDDGGDEGNNDDQSSSSDDDKKAGGGGDDDDNKQGIVEQIFNRDKKD